MEKRAQTALGSQRGMSIVELMTAITIMAILMGIGTLGFKQMQTKADIEAQTKELYADLMKARSEALFQKTDRSIKITGTSQITVYGTSDGSGAAVWPQRDYTKNQPITSSDTNTLAFDADGVANLTTANPTKAFCVGPAGNSAGVDAVAITNTSITLGKLNGGACSSANIDPK